MTHDPCTVYHIYISYNHLTQHPCAVCPFHSVSHEPCLSGRLRHHIESADPPAVGRAMFLVLDEADRLLAPGFSSEIQIILNAMHPNR